MKRFVYALSLVSSVALAFAVGCSSSSSPGGGGGSGGSGGSAATECYETSGSGSTMTCAYSGSSETGFSCPAPTKSGSCPSSGLVGCCGDSITSDGVTVIAGACYYSTTTGNAAKSACKSPDTWSTSAQ